MDVRRFGAQYRSPSYTLARTVETYETYYDIVYPDHERQAGRPLRTTPGVPVARRARRVLRREVRLGAGQLLREQRRRGRRVAATAGLGRPALVAGDRRRSTAATRETAGLFDESSFAKLDGDRAGRRRAAPVGLRQRRRARRRRRHVHAGAQRARAGSSRTSRSPARPRTRSWSSPVRRSAGTTWPGCTPGPPPRRPPCGRGRHRPVRSYAMWGPRSREILRGADRRRPVETTRSRS